MNAHSRHEYEMGIIRDLRVAFSKPLPSLSDEDKGNEWKAQNIFYLALGEFRSKVQDAQALTNVKKDMLGDLLDGLDDLTPDAIAWSEAISAGGIK